MELGLIMIIGRAHVPTVSRRLLLLQRPALQVRARKKKGGVEERLSEQCLNPPPPFDASSPSTREAAVGSFQACGKSAPSPFRLLSFTLQPLLPGAVRRFARIALLRHVPGQHLLLPGQRALRGLRARWVGASVQARCPSPSLPPPFFRVCPLSSFRGVRVFPAWSRPDPLPPPTRPHTRARRVAAGERGPRGVPQPLGPSPLIGPPLSAVLSPRLRRAP